MKAAAMNRTNRKPLLLTFIFLLLASCISAQGFVYRTFEDFQQQKYAKADSTQFLFMSGYGNVITLKNKDEWKGVDIWGFVWNGSLYRRVHVKGQHTLKVLAVGEYVLYSFFHIQSSQDGREYPRTIYYISKDLGSPAYRADKNHMDKLTNEDEAFAKLEKYVDGAPAKRTLEDVVEEYITKSKEFKPLQSFLPAAK